MPSLTELQSWQGLQALADVLQRSSVSSLFAQQNQRFDEFSVSAAGVFLDYSKNRVTREVMGQLFEVAIERGLPEAINAMFSGDQINQSEARSVLHTALRSRSKRLVVNGVDVMTGIREQLAKMAQLVDEVRSGEWRGVTGKPIADVVNIGIGGSDLGPRMVAEALADPAASNPGVQFVSNVDGEHLLQTLAGLDPETTLFIITSKSFTTEETLINATSARRWVRDALGSDVSVRSHFVAVSSNVSAAVEFGIDASNVFQMWDWVGGRYSLWSAAGLAIALACGMEVFSELLAGAADLDEHFCQAPMDQNLPVILALVGIWNRNFQDIESLMIAPYDQRLASLPAYLQQADMESNGKSVDSTGKPVGVKTAPIVWGGAGSNIQHSYMQLLHQGNVSVASDFIVSRQPRTGSTYADHHRLLVANCFAQAQALMQGRSQQQAADELIADGVNPDQAEALAAQQQLPGNQPSNMIMVDNLGPRQLGALLALYEQKIFVQGVIWGVNSFDQWGVALGKTLATTILSTMARQRDGQSAPLAAGEDGSTLGLIRRFRG
ncbi:MAG: glucose-6-phosphate isomerase [Immundisolibacteraceae bacterium]|nr:glucose-6-phosphate isomerase [Immundisolibacteraceae bacterium]